MDEKNKIKIDIFSLIIAILAFLISVPPHSHLLNSVIGVQISN